MHKSLLVAFFVIAASSGIDYSVAETVTPYPNPGTPNSDVYSFRAISTGNVTGFFASASAADISVVGLSVNGAAPTVFGLNNQTTAFGQSVNLGSVVAGDVLTFVLRNQTTNTQLTSNPGSNPDGLQYAFAERFAGAGALPSGLLIAFEDLTKAQDSDFDYNDAIFVFTNVTTLSGGKLIANPLPAALSLFTGGLGVLGVAFVLGGRKSRRRRIRI